MAAFQYARQMAVLFLLLAGATAGLAGCKPIGSTAPDPTAAVVRAPDTSPAPTRLAEPLPVNGTGYVVLNAPVTPLSRDMFRSSVDRLRAAGAREIDIGINSPGGSIDAAQDIVAYMARMHRENGVTFKAYNLGFVASAATYIFLNAQQRYAGPQGRFLFHAAGMMANGPINSDQLRDSADKLDAYERTVRATLAARTRLTNAEAQTYVRRTVVLSADDARRDGVVDGIADLQLPPNARAYVITAAPGGPTPTNSLPR